jgi:hypothetical protein
MQNRLLFLSIIFLTTFAQATAQYTNVDFEPAGIGASWVWVMDQNGDEPPLEFIANPVSGGLNTSATVAKFTARAAGQPFALTFTDDIAPFVLNATNVIIKIMVYKTKISNVTIKLEGSSAPVEIGIANTVINQWEEITYNFSASVGNSYSRLIVIPDFASGRTENIIYFDNIQLPSGNITPPAAPTTAAPTPIHDETTNAVISIFSDSYTNVPGTDTDPFWGQATNSTEELIAGNNTLKYENLNYQGTQFGSNQDVSAREFLHVDFWTSNSTDLGIYLISPGGREKEHVFTIIPNQWNSIEIELSDFVPPVILSDVFQFKVEGNGNVWFDNLYFYAPAAFPVSLSNFSAEAQGKRTHLHWETATETDNDHFQIERSVAGSVFTPIATVSGIGNSTSTQSYEAWDESPSAGINYYRLKQVDVDGTATYFNTLSVSFASDRPLALVNCNVISQNVQLTYYAASGGRYEVMVVDMAGRVLHQDAVTFTEGLNEVSFDTPASGIIVSMLSNGKQRSVDKILKPNR